LEKGFPGTNALAYQAHTRWKKACQEQTLKLIKSIHVGKRLATDKHSRLSRASPNYGHGKFYNFGQLSLFCSLFATSLLL
jgi:hypothetical protein